MKLQAINRHDIDKDSRCREGKAQHTHADDDRQLDQALMGLEAGLSLAIRKHPVGMKPKIRKGFVSPP